MNFIPPINYVDFLVFCSLSAASFVELIHLRCTFLSSASLVKQHNGLALAAFGCEFLRFFGISTCDLEFFKVHPEILRQFFANGWVEGEF